MLLGILVVVGTLYAAFAILLRALKAVARCWLLLPRRRTKRLAVTVLLGLFISAAGCKRSSQEEGYRVTSYDATTHQWAIIRSGNFDGKYLRKRLIVVCDFYQWGQHEAVTGNEACDLRVGELIVSNPFPGPGKEQDFVEVFEMPDKVLSITRGSGADRVTQQFKILKYDVLPDGE